MIPEAVMEIMRYGFEDLKLNRMWCGYFDFIAPAEHIHMTFSRGFSFLSYSVVLFFSIHCLSPDNINKKTLIRR